ncbi:hypothetical protein GOP47_0020462 [Adiantum capillus-veneris]|uniref:RRM domain-containing protein n=1 Tax=Adiantum capillus-veneris TaxID=13818 RepID=A0A9D4UA10_ADICA|nr:hypothetical protein GOP47_0020462 [Adiantum capillus-veneris]
MENGVEKPAKIKGTEVFVGGLQQSTTEETLREAFREFGDICEIRLMKDQNGNLKGYAFIRFTTKEAAAKAQKEKHGATVQGKKIRVSPSTDQDRIFIGSLKKEWTQKDVDSMIRQAFQDVVDVELAVVPDAEGTSAGKKRTNRGFGFITFKDHSAAARAYRIGNKPDFILEGNWHPIIDWAQTETDFDPDEMAKVTVAFVSNLPSNVTEDFLRKVFEPFGKLERVAISRKAEFPVGFIHFVNRSDLESAIKELDGKSVKGPDKKQSFKLQVAVSKPVDKSKKRAREDFDGAVQKSGVQKKLDTGSTYPSAGALGPPRVIVDPYELAVLGLLPNVTEKLLQIFRRGLIAQHEIDVHVLEDLRDVPEASAVDILDKFASSNLMDIRSKGGYLASLIRKSKKDAGSSKKGLKRVVSERAGKPLQNGPINVGITPSSALLSYGYHLIPRVSTGSEALGYGGYSSALSSAALSSGLADSSIYTRTPSALGDALSLPSYRSSSATLGVSGLGGLGSYSGMGNLGTYSSLVGLGSLGVGREASAPEHRPFKFDPYTGEPFKFDPYTGEPLQHSGTSLASLGSRFF